MAETTLGQRIAMKRKELGLSQTSLGEQLGVSRQSIFKWESDGAIPEIDKLIALSRLFGVSVGWLLGIEPDPTPKTEAPDFTEREKQLLEQFAQPKPDSAPWQKIVTIVTAVCAAVSLVLSGMALYQTHQNNKRAAQLQEEVKQFLIQSGDWGTALNMEAADLVYQSSYTCTPNLEMTQVEVSMDIVPLVYQEENKCTVQVLLEDEVLASYDCSWNGQSYHVDFPLDAANGYQLLFCVEDVSGAVRAQALVNTTVLYLEHNLAWPKSGSVTAKAAVFYTDCMELQELTLDIPLPRIFRNQEGIWEKCDLVLTDEDGQELDRIDLMHRSAYSEKIDFSGGDVNFTTRSQTLSFPALEDRQCIYLNVECTLTTGHSFQYPVGAWQKDGQTFKELS